MSINQEVTYDADDAAAALDALHAALSCDLEELEAKIRAAAPSMTMMPNASEREMAEYREARTALHSGLASIAEVLAWIRFKTEEDPEGEVAVAIQPLPTLRGCWIH